MRVVVAVTLASCCIALQIPSSALGQDTPQTAIAQAVNTTVVQSSEVTQGLTTDSGQDPGNWCQDSASAAQVFPHKTLWSRFRGTGGPVRISTLGSGYDTVVIAFKADGPLPGAPVPTCSDDYSTGVWSEWEFATEAGQDYLVQVGGCSKEPFDFLDCGTGGNPYGQLALTILGNDRRDFPEVLTSGTPVTRTNIAARFYENDEPRSCDGVPYGNTVWYALDAPGAGTAVVRTVGDPLVLSAYRASDLGRVSCAKGASGADYSELRVAVPAAGRYLVQVAAPDSSPIGLPDFKLTYDFTPAPPVPDRDGDKDPNETDCAPDDPSRGRLATEILKNGIDENCDGRDGRDADGDGEDDRPFGPDCLFTGADAKAVNSKAREVPGNAVDENCDGKKAIRRLRTPAIDPKTQRLEAGTRVVGFLFGGLGVSNLEEGRRVRVRCVRRCPLRLDVTRRAPGGEITIKPRIEGKRLKSGALFEVRTWAADRPYFAGRYKRVEVLTGARRRSREKSCEGNLRPGSSRIQGRACRPR